MKNLFVIVAYPNQFSVRINDLKWNCGKRKTTLPSKLGPGWWRARPQLAGVQGQSHCCFSPTGGCLHIRKKQSAFNRGVFCKRFILKHAQQCLKRVTKWSAHACVCACVCVLCGEKIYNFHNEAKLRLVTEVPFNWANISLKLGRVLQLGRDLRDCLGKNVLQNWFIHQALIIYKNMFYVDVVNPV